MASANHHTAGNFWNISRELERLPLALGKLAESLLLCFPADRPSTWFSTQQHPGQEQEQLPPTRPANVFALSLSWHRAFFSTTNFQCDCQSCLKRDRKITGPTQKICGPAPPHTLKTYHHQHQPGTCTLSKDEATALADVHETIAPHLILHACSARFLMSGISC